VILALLLLMLGAVAPPSAPAHDQGRDSVDCTIPFDCEIRWEDYSRFDNTRRYGIAQWNRLARVDIVPDVPLTVADLEFIDYSKCDVAWDGFWSPRRGADVIAFNPCTVRSRKFYDPPDPRAVAVHELGHALRLAHPPSGGTLSRYWRARSIMFCCPRCGPTSTYHAHDIRDYRATW